MGPMGGGMSMPMNPGNGGIILTIVPPSLTRQTDSLAKLGDLHDIPDQGEGQEVRRILLVSSQGEGHATNVEDDIRQTARERHTASTQWPGLTWAATHSRGRTRRPPPGCRLAPC